MEELIKVRNLKKSYKNNTVLNGISFSVNRGEILCFLGPNGAGKSTTINILTGALGYDEGELSCDGKSIARDIRDFKQRLGIVPQELALYEDITAEENVKFFASLYGLRGSKLKKRTDEAIEFAGLTARAKDKVNTYSGGMKRRLNIACAIAHSPELLIMDEPTVGIDPQSRNHILSSIRELRDKGMTILYTTHYMEEVEEISTRIIIMDKGDIIAEGTKEKLKENIENEKRLIIELENTEDLDPDVFYRIDGVRDVTLSEGTLMVTTLKGVENLDRVISSLSDSGCRINNITCKTSSLETVFLKLTGKSLRD
jgi:ABC-2 type transport system ATP-binding protein